MAKERANEPPVSPAAKPFREAMERLAAGDLGGAVRGMLLVHSQHTDTEEAYFVEEQLARVRRLWPQESEKAGLTEDAWKLLQERAARRRANAKRPKGAPFVVGVMAVLGAWALLVAAAPGTAFLGRIEVPYVFRAVAAVAGIVALADAFALFRLKWEAVNVFIVLVPVFMIVTFIGLTESGDTLGKVICGTALAAQAGAAWYMSRESHHFTL
jgi:hypothetical protein